MINLPTDYDSAAAYTGASPYEPLPTGGHVCKIIGARVTKSKAGNDMLEVMFDIAGNDLDAGRFNERYQAMKKKNPDAKWPAGGIFRTGILTKEGKTSGFFKGLITSVEESNPGYSFKGSGANESTLAGKMVGFNFGEDEYPNRDGEIRTSVKPFYAISVQTVREGIDPPPVRKYKGPTGAMKGFTEVENDEPLPF